MSKRSSKKRRASVSLSMASAGRDPDACQESGQAGCRSSPRRPDEKRIKKITVSHEFDSAGHAAALFELRSSTRSS